MLDTGLMKLMMAMKVVKKANFRTRTPPLTGLPGSRRGRINQHIRITRKMRRGTATRPGDTDPATTNPAADAILSGDDNFSPTVPPTFTSYTENGQTR